MRVAIACETMGVVHRGGEIQLQEIGRRLAAAGHDVMLYGGAPLAAAPARNVTFRAVAGPLARRTQLGGKAPIAAAKADTLWFGARAYGHMLRSPLDIVVPVHPPLHERLARLVRARWKARVVAFGLGGPDHDRMRIESAPDLFIVSSPRAARQASARSKRLRVEVVPPGVDLDRFRPDGERLDVGLPRPVVGVFGALLACKRIELAIEAVARMSEGSLLVVGDGPERARLMRLGARLGSRFRLIDSVPQVEVPALMRAIDLLCFPADPDETFGMVLVEAMACGRPVVANDDEVRRWIVGDAGALCDVTDVDALAQTLQRAATQPRDTRRQAERFSWSTAIGRLDQLFRELG